MKQIELKLKTHSKTWITPVLLIFIAFFAMAMVSPINAAPPIQCDRFSFCDQDGDGITRDHKKCLKACGEPADCDDNVFDSDNNCNGGSDLSYVTSPADNWAFWDGGNYIWEETPNLDLIPRYCGNGDPADPNPQGHVAYICHEYAYATWPMVNTVHIKLDDDWRDGTPEGPGDNGLTADDICKFAEGGSTGGALVMNLLTSESRAYYYSMDPTWNEGPCINLDTCLVLFATSAYFDNGTNHPEHCSDRKCGRLVQLAGWGIARPAGEIDDIYEYNPFVYEQDIPIVDLTVTFRAIGKNKVAASCHYDVPGEQIYFRTRIEQP